MEQLWRTPGSCWTGEHHDDTDYYPDNHDHDHDDHEYHDDNDHDHEMMMMMAMRKKREIRH